MSEFVTPADAATISNRHVVTVRKALEAGELHGFQRVVGGRWSIARPCLIAWVEGRPCEHASGNVALFRRSRSA